MGTPKGQGGTSASLPVAPEYPVWEACWRLFGITPVLTLGIIAGITASTLYNGWVHPIGFFSHGSIELLVFAGEVMLVVISYLEAVLRGPGFVPRGWTPTPGDFEQRLGRAEDRPLVDVQVPWQDCLQSCRHCLGYKPARAHHCSSCRRCVLWMDHHCPWTNTCIGYNNMKDFVLFVHYVPLACLHATIVHSEILFRLGRILFRKTQSHLWRYLLRAQTLWGLFILLVAVIVMFLVGSLACEMQMSISQNVTLVEDLIVDKATKRRFKFSAAEFESPYDLGVKKNWELIMGRTWLHWLLPSKSLTCDPLWPPLRPGSRHFDLSCEQLAQQAHKLSKSVIVQVAKSFNGAGRCCCMYWLWIACRFGFSAACCSPEVCGQPRLSVEAGAEILVSQEEKDWVFARHLESGIDSNGGWIPRQCAATASEKYEVPYQRKLQGTWEREADGGQIRVSGVCVIVLNAPDIHWVLREDDGSACLLGCHVAAYEKGRVEWSNGEVWRRPRKLQEDSKEVEVEKESLATDAFDSKKKV